MAQDQQPTPIKSSTSIKIKCKMIDMISNKLGKWVFGAGMWRCVIHTSTESSNLRINNNNKA